MLRCLYAEHKAQRRMYEQFSPWCGTITAVAALPFADAAITLRVDHVSNIT